MKIEEIVKIALADKYYNKCTGEIWETIPYFKINHRTIHISQPIKPDKIMVLRRLLKVSHNNYNIVVCEPNI